MEAFYSDMEALAASLRLQVWRLETNLPWRLVELSRLRGLWGMALHALDLDVYRRVFEGTGDDGTRHPLYVLRPAPDWHGGAATLECLFFGAALEREACLLQAWEAAAERGYGKSRDAFTLVIKASDAGLAHSPASLYAARNTPWRLDYISPVRLLRQGKLIAEPALRDVALAALRRLYILRGEETISADPWPEMSEKLLQACDRIPVTYDPAGRGAVERYSARQKREVNMRCVSGGMTFPEGPGPLLPLLHTAQWMHIGKGATIGMGQLRLRPLANTGTTA